MEAFWAGLVQISNGVGEKLIIQSIFFVLLFLGGWLLKWWTQRKYGLRISMIMCFLEKAGAHSLLYDEYIAGGSSLEVLGGKKLAKQFIAAVNRTQDGGMMKEGSWTPDEAQKFLKEFGNRISMQFRDGTLARALRDESVTKGTFFMAVFRRTARDVSVILVQEKDMNRVAQPTEEELIRGDIQECEEIAQLFSHNQISQQYVLRKLLAR